MRQFLTITQYNDALFLQQTYALISICIRRIVVIAISFYQNFLSPLKGFSCAYRLYHKSESCSCYVKRVFVENDLRTAIAFADQRFQDCMLASELLDSESDSIINNDNLVGRRKVMKIFSFFPLSFLLPQAASFKGNCCGNNSSSDRSK